MKNVTNGTEIKTPVNGWVHATKLPSYKELYDLICHLAGEGELVTAEQVGKTPRDFLFDEIRLIELRGSEILYSTDPNDGAISADFIGVWSAKN
jgi:hypothetical protein